MINYGYATPSFQVFFRLQLNGENRFGCHSSKQRDIDLDNTSDTQKIAYIALCL